MERTIPRPEFPRPDFERKDWRSLNGVWRFEFGSKGDKQELNYYRGENLERQILVPFCYQAKASGIGEGDYHETVWYAKEFLISENEIVKTCLLKFGAVDYDAKIWVNGEYIGCHQGGHVQFSFDISRYLKVGNNVLAVSAGDDRTCDRARGKQYWKDKPDRCWYQNTTGIWLDVWLEFTGESYLTGLRLTPDIDRKGVELELYLNKGGSVLLEVEVTYGGKQKKWFSTVLLDAYEREWMTLKEEDNIDEIHYWSPETPNLYEIVLTLKQDGEVVDRVYSYFGMRKIHSANGSIYLNNKILYQRLVLDQGYWPESLMTPPSDEALCKDIVMTKKMGFNGARKHQKFEDPRYYYWADKLGLLVWGELPSGYLFNSREVVSLQREWIEFVEQTYNHPSVIIWAVLNESWGVRNIVTDQRQQAFAAGLYYMTRALDGTRLVSSNDGWEQVEETDIFAIHDYAKDGGEIVNRYKDLSQFIKTGIPNRQALCEGHAYQGQPFLLTEFGGMAFTGGDDKDWGYHESAQDAEEFCARVGAMVVAIEELKEIKGFCYTQLTDVMQEVNGLLNESREPKADVGRLYSIFSK